MNMQLEERKQWLLYEFGTENLEQATRDLAIMRLRLRIHQAVQGVDIS